MGKNIKFGNTEIEQHKFHQYQRPISMKNININEIIVSNKISFGKKDFKYFIGYEDANRLDLINISLKKVHIEETLTKVNICLF